MLGNVVDVEPLTGGAELAPGTCWRETRVLAGRRSTRTLTVVECEPGYSVVVHSDVEGTLHGMTYTLTAAGQGSELSLELGPLPAAPSDGGPTGPHPDGAAAPTAGAEPPMSPAFAGLSATIVAVQMRDDLDDFAAAAEARVQVAPVAEERR